MNTSFCQNYSIAVSGDFNALNQYKGQAGVYGLSGLYISQEYTPLYIGSSNDIERRIKEHWKELRNGNHKNSHLQRAWNKHPEQFAVVVFETCNQENYLEREQEYLDTVKPYDGGFNKAKDARCPTKGRTLSYQHRKKLSDAKVKPFPPIINRITGEIVRNGLGADVFAKERGLNKGHFWSMLHGKIPSHKDWILLK